MPFDAAKQSDRHGRSPAGGRRRGRSSQRHSTPPEVRDGSNVASATSCLRRRTVGWGRCRRCGRFKRSSRTDGFQEELLHDQLEARAAEYGPLLRAIRGYEAFVRSLQDGFDVLRAEAAGLDAQGFAVPRIAADQDFERSVSGLHERFETAHHALGDVNLADGALPNLFTERFGAFAEPMNAAACALALCTHHETVQRKKSADGKRPWFDWLGQDRIYIRHAYRVPRREVKPDCYVHDYRGQPIRRFHTDLS